MFSVICTYTLTRDFINMPAAHKQLPNHAEIWNNTFSIWNRMFENAVSTIEYYM